MLILKNKTPKVFRIQKIKLYETLQKKRKQLKFSANKWRKQQQFLHIKVDGRYVCICMMQHILHTHCSMRHTKKNAAAAVEAATPTCQHKSLQQLNEQFFTNKGNFWDAVKNFQKIKFWKMAGISYRLWQFPPLKQE